MTGPPPTGWSSSESAPVSNRRGTCRKVTSAAGLDTVSFVLRPQTDDDHAHLSEWMERSEVGRDELRGSKLIKSPRGVLVSRPVAGVRFGAFHGDTAPAAWVEGRLVALLAGSDKAHGLAGPADLVPGAAKAREVFAGLGLDLAAPVEGVRRADLAGDLSFADGADGLAFLRALASLDVPRLKRDVWAVGPRVETVYYKTPKAGEVRMRAYDKGVESGTAAPGERVRFEMQRRYRKALQMTPRNLAEMDWATSYRERLGPWERSADGFAVVALRGAQEAVLNAVREGATMRDGSALTMRRAERMIGSLVILSELGPEWYENDDTARRRAREFQDLGVALDLERITREPVPVAALLKLLAEAFGGRVGDADEEGAPKDARQAPEDARRAKPKARTTERRRADCGGDRPT